MSEIEIVHYNPKRKIFSGRLGRIFPIKKPLNNFGDLLGPLVAQHLLRNEYGKFSAQKNVRLLTIGSIIHFARDGDVIWGSGINGKVPLTSLHFSELDVRSVRGPLTRDILIERGIDVPEVFGDPGLLTPLIYPHLKELQKTPRYDYTFIPNYNDIPRFSDELWYSPQSGLMNCLERIAKSRFVTGTSLHAIIIAESLGIPARAIRSNNEHEFKYADYFTGTGRDNFAFADSIEQALSMGGEQPIDISNISQPIINSFPFDLWHGID
ncbi:polysaccharide biosynthesis protein [Methylophaga lonarensis MPL]|uniref:Polysaccharide biosynthesis protein n=1 Tax=Methylophaga lonarensis MPL TaxID=1286106 RepID=M7PKF9_9GAMM|nr:polysaccharide pyruvyl transferase family protein [Methylophaga lonarensis]EMR14350.1 polysaccharide biosynthesis protein [Methylophaga lonarensis MPL]